MKPEMKRLAIGFADRLGGALLISLNLHFLATAHRKLRRWRAAP